jgi:thiosulfate/3-mercaptopyruvate sulfurtransferase
MSHDPVVELSALPSMPAFRLLDVRDPAAFSSGHATNAVRVPIEVWEAAAKAGETSFEKHCLLGARDQGARCGRRCAGRCL